MGSFASVLVSSLAMAMPALAQVQFEVALLPGGMLPLATESASGDFDGDGDRDLFVLSSLGSRLFRNDGGGVVTDVTALLPVMAGNQRSAAFVDIDGDQRRDLLLSWTGVVWLLRSTPAGFVDVSGNLPSGLPTIHGVAVADLDGDGDEDLVCAGSNLDAGRNQVLTNDGTGVFAASQPCPGADFRVLVGDLDGDGDLDVIHARPSFKLFRNDGAGVFTDVAATQLPNNLGMPAELLLGDCDGDGDLDLFVGGSQLGDQLLVNDGLGTFLVAFGAVPAAVGATQLSAWIDVDGDGDLDLARGTANAGPPTLALNDGLGNFLDASSRLPAVTAWLSQVRATDLDGDRDPELILTGLGTAPQVLWNHHRHLRVVQLPVVGGLLEVELAAQPGYGVNQRAAVFGITLQRLPVPVVLDPLGELHLDLAGPGLQQSLWFQSFDVPQRLSFAVPALPALVGLPLHLQALVEEQPGPLGARFTSALTVVVQ